MGAFSSYERRQFQLGSYPKRQRNALGMAKIAMITLRFNLLSIAYPGQFQAKYLKWNDFGLVSC